MSKKIDIRSIALIIILFIAGCNYNKEAKPLKIAISKAIPIESYANYIHWLKKTDSSIVCMEMYHLKIDSALKLFAQCDGLLLTGGTDIYPGIYGRERDTAICWEPDLKRDSLELALVGAALDQKKPILGICRGLQLLNVFLGGSLYVDLPTELDTIVAHQNKDQYNCFHDLTILERSVLFELAGSTTGIVNSNHHQGIDHLAESLVGTSHSDDGLAESIEWKNRNYKPFLIGVQWHPERMDFNNPLSGKLVQRYLNEVLESKN